MHNLDSSELVSDFDVAVFETGFAKIVEYFGEEAKEMEFSFNAFPQTLMNDEKRWKIIQLIRSYAGTFHLNIEIVEDHNK